MPDPRHEALADVVVRYSTRVKKGDLVAIRSDPAAMPLIEAIYIAVLKAGGHPFWEARGAVLADVYFEHAQDHQLEFLDPIQTHLVETVDVRIALWAETNTKMLSGVDPALAARFQAANKPLMTRFLERAAEGNLRWCGTLFPTLAAAQDAEMSLRDYERFVYRAGLLDHADPVSAWQKIYEQQERVREFLQTKNQLRFQSPATDQHDGTDLVVDVDNSKSIWVNCAGQENFPDGEVFCGPQGVDGHVNYTFPAVYGGREVEGVRLEFKAGRVVNASARKNEEYLFAMLDQDEGARNLGEIAIGTNYAIKDFSKNTLFDEKIGGTFHAAVGAGYPESGSFNESGLHWDMVCDLRPTDSIPGGTIEADGEVFHKDGHFLNAGWPGS